jgi:signal transduction histidine kinase
MQLLGLYLLFVIPVLLGGAGIYLFQRNTLEQSASRSDQGLAQAVALDIGAYVQSASEFDLELATNQAAGNFDQRQLNTLLSYAYGTHPDINEYFIIGTSGRMVFNYPSYRATIGKDYSHVDYFQEAIHSNSPFVSGQWVSDTTSTSVFTVAAPIRNHLGQIVGILGVNYSLDIFNLHLQTIERQLSPTSEVGLWIIDRYGQTVATTKSDPTSQDLPDLPAQITSLAQVDGSGSVIDHQQNRDWLYSAVPAPEADWFVVVQRPADVTFAVVTEFQHGLIVALVLVIIGVTFFWYMVRWRLIAPLTRLASAVSLVQPNQPVHGAPVTLLVSDQRRIDEIGKLTTAFLVMEQQIRSHLQKSDETIQTQFHTLEAILRSMDEGVLLESPSGEIVYANPAFSRAVGIPQQELHASSTHDGRLRERVAAMLTPPTTYQDVLEPAEPGPVTRMVEFQLCGLYRKRGRFVPAQRDIRMRLFHVRGANNQLIGRGKIFQDVTPEHEAERIKHNLLAIVSHELRTPLTAIKGYATGLLDEADGEIDRNWQRHSLGKIVDESNRLADLVTNLLDMSQIEAGTLKLYPEPHFLIALTDEAVALAFPPESRPCVRTRLPDTLPLLNVDRRRIVLVLRNLLENARRYGGPDLLIEMTATCEESQTATQAGLTLTITDNGPGIPVDLTDRIFDRFYQVENGAERSRNGVGLGLAICRGFVEAHQGRIWATNRTDGARGAVFHLWFPHSTLGVHASRLLKQ